MKRRQAEHQSTTEMKQMCKNSFRYFNCIDFYNYPDIVCRSELNRREKKRCGKIVGKKFRSYYKAINYITRKSWSKNET